MTVATTLSITYRLAGHKITKIIKAQVPPNVMEEYKQPQNNDPLINETESGDPRFLLKLRSRKVGIAPDRNCIVVDISDGIIINVRNIAMAVDTMVKVISGTRIM